VKKNVTPFNQTEVHRSFRDNLQSRRDSTSQASKRKEAELWLMLASGRCFVGLFLETEDGCNMFLRIVVEILQDYKIVLFIVTAAIMSKLQILSI
jgi:hypothetical protein